MIARIFACDTSARPRPDFRQEPIHLIHKLTPTSETSSVGGLSFAGELVGTSVSIPMVRLRHQLLQKNCSKVMVSQLLSHGEDSDRHGVYPKPDFNRNVTFKLVSIIGGCCCRAYVRTVPLAHSSECCCSRGTVCGACVRTVPLAHSSECCCSRGTVCQVCLCPGEPHDSKFCLTEHAAKHQTKRNPANDVFEANWIIDRKFADPILRPDQHRQI